MSIPNTITYIKYKVNRNRIIFNVFRMHKEGRN